MKLKNILFILIATTLSGCGGDNSSTTPSAQAPCADSPLVGPWTLLNNDTLIFTSSCQFSDTKCGSTGTYPHTTEKSGVLAITIQTPAGAPLSCLATGSYRCTYAIESGALSYICH